MLDAFDLGLIEQMNKETIIRLIKQNIKVDIQIDDSKVLVTVSLDDEILSVTTKELKESK